METAHRPADELAVFRDLRPEIGFGLGVVDIKSTEIETADADRARDRARRNRARRRADQVHPPGLRLLDAQAQHRGRKNSRAGKWTKAIKDHLSEVAGHPVIEAPNCASTPNCFLNLFDPERPRKVFCRRFIIGHYANVSIAFCIQFAEQLTARSCNGTSQSMSAIAS